MSTSVEIAEEFGRRIARADYAAAHALLTLGAQRVHSPADLKSAVEKMTSYSSGPIQEVAAVPDCILEDWPSKMRDDVAYIYVALNGDEFSEAVTVTLARERGEILVRELEWGRP